MNGAISQAFERLLDASWQVALLVAVVLGLDLVLRTKLGRVLGARVRYGLWLIVAVRLMMPALPHVEWAPVPWKSASEYVRGELSIDPAPEFDVDQVAAQLREGLRAARAGELPAHERPIPRERTTGANDDERAFVPAAPVEDGGSFDPRRVAVGGWLVGAAAVLALGLIRDLRFRRRLWRAPEITEARIQRLLEHARRDVGLGRAVQLHRCTALGSPAAYGILRPKILLPDDADLSDEELAHVFRHELSHLRRGDLWLQPLLLVLRAAWWFHPAVHVALARLRSAQEETRDFDALACQTDPAPLTYAQVLVAIAERSVTGPIPPRAIPMARTRRGLQRRLDMILNFARPSRFARVAGAVLIGGTAWGALVSAPLPVVQIAAVPPAPSAASEPEPVERASVGVAEAETDPAVAEVSPPEPARAEAEAETQAEIDPAPRQIAVEHASERPAWMDAIEQRLASPVGVSFVDTPVHEIAADVARKAELPVAIDRDFFDDHGDPTLSVSVDGVSAREVLDLLALATDEMGWSVADGIVHVGSRGETPRHMDVRFYRIGPILDSLVYEDEDDARDAIVVLVQESGSRQIRDTWDWNYSSIELVDDVLIVHQEERVHRSVASALDQLLQRRSRSGAPASAWSGELAQRLEKPLGATESFDYVSELLRFLRTEHGLSVIAEDHEDALGHDLEFSMTEATVGQALEALGRATDRFPVPMAGTIVLSYDPELELALHSVTGLLENANDEDILDVAAGLILDTVDPKSWDMSPLCSLFCLDDLLVVNQSPKNQDAIERLLAAMERAMEDR